MPKHNGHVANDMDKGNLKYYVNANKLSGTEWSTSSNAFGWQIYRGDEVYPYYEELGNNQPHTNMPPYLTVNIYVRKE